MKRRIVLLGPPGSGKGTVAAQLQAREGLEHVCSGHLLRQTVAMGSAPGTQVGPYLDQGELVPDPLVLTIMERWLNGLADGASFVLDGFPRTLNQATVLDEWLAKRQLPIEKAILFIADEAEILDRVTGRRSCPRCGQVYHVTRVPPRQAGRCDKCGVALVQRTDDSVPVMRKRFEIYRRETVPLQPYYQQQGKLAVVDVTDSPEARFTATCAAIRS